MQKFIWKNTIILTLALVLATALLLTGCEKKQPAPPSTPTARPAHAQTTCPVMGGNIDKNHYADYQAKRIYFCCPGCSDTFNKDPDKYVKALRDQGVTLADTPKPATP